MRYILLTLFLLLLLPGTLLAQQISIALGKSPLPLNQYYTIGIQLHDQALKEYSPFPEIEGFKKSSKYSSTETIITSGSTTKILTVYQNYAPLAEGEFVLKPFSMKINGQTVQSPGTTIVVKPMATAVTLHTDNKHIRVNGQVYHEPYKHKKLLAYLPQNDFLPQNIRLDKIIDLYTDDLEKRETIKQNERITKHLRKHPYQLSKGELRYFELLLLLQKDVQFLLLDEPFSGIEPIYVDYITELLQAELNSKGFIITDHDYQSVLRVSNRIILLTNGTCRPINHPEELAQWGYIPASAFS